MSKLGDGSYCGVPNCPCGGVKSIENMTREEWHADIARREAKQREGHLKRWMEDATREAHELAHADGDLDRLEPSLMSDFEAMRELEALESAAREALTFLEQQDAIGSHRYITLLRSALKAL